MLKDKLYTYKKIDGDSLVSLKFQIKIQADHAIFDGHFPGNPIVPGVCQMEMVKEIFRDYLGKDVLFDSVADMKFITMWVPDESKMIYLDLSAKDIEGGYKINARIYSNEEVYFKLKGSANVC